MAFCPDCKRGDVATHTPGPGTAAFLNVHGDESGLRTCSGSGGPAGKAPS